MDSLELKGTLKGFFGLLFILILAILTYLFSEELLKYSGITTFYSLLILIILFVFKEYLDRGKQEKEDLNDLKSVLIATEQVQGNLKYYSESIDKGMVPVHKIAYFDIELPLIIQGKNSKGLSDLIFFANDKIDSLNQLRDDFMKITVERLPDMKRQQKAMNKYIELIGSSLNDAEKDLSDCLENIKKVLKAWRIY